MNRKIKTGSEGRRRGMVLIVVLWIVLTLAGLVLVFARSMRVELLISANQLAASRAEWIARGALEFAIAHVDNSDGTVRPGQDVSCEAVSLGDGYFWILSPDPEDDLNYTFGISDEGAKLNLNTATLEMLLMLPGMTDELAASIVDWRSSDEASTVGGAKNEYYLLLTPPYQCKSGPFETVEELLLVKGADEGILFGGDINRNGIIDSKEEGGVYGLPRYDAEGVSERGIYDFVTVYSNQANVSREGAGFVNVNGSDDDALAELLRGVLSAERLSTVMGIVRRGRPFGNLLDFYSRTGLTVEEFRQIAPGLTVGRGGRQAGLINVNTAPKQVLLCLPGLEEGDVDALIAKREATDTDRSNIAWVAEVLPGEKAAEAGNWISVRSYQFSADIIAASSNGRAFRRYRAVIDGRNSPPRVVSWQDLTGLGWPLIPEILAGMKRGVAPAEAGIF